LKIKSTNLQLRLLPKDGVLELFLCSGVSEILLQNPHSVKLYFHLNINKSIKHKDYIKIRLI